MAVDPVCRMEVDETKAKYTFDYRGKRYYFCAPACRQRFARDPEKYLAASPQEPLEPDEQG